MREQQILIAGGGIAGLATSLGMALNARPCLVLERAPEFEEFGAGLQLGPNAVRALQQLGAWDTVAPACVIPSEIQIRDGLSGKLLQRIKLGRSFEELLGAPYRVVHRADLHQGLLLSAQNSSYITLRTGAEVKDADIRQSAVTLAHGETLQGGAIIAADGVHSLFRKKIQHEMGHAPLGHRLHRALIPFSHVPVSTAIDAVTLWLMPHAHMVHYAVSNWSKFNIVASLTKTDQNVNDAFGDACAPLLDILEAVREWTAWPGLEVAPNAAWFAHKTLMVGDAAHATLPYLAQGAAMALEDACELSLLTRNRADISMKYADFTKLRFARTSKIQLMSRRQSFIYHASGATRMARNMILRAMPSHSLINQLSWIYAWQPSAMSR